jgi:hypothetical protein
LWYTKYRRFLKALGPNALFHMHPASAPDLFSLLPCFLGRYLSPSIV